jgi:hypothetical protein
MKSQERSRGDCGSTGSTTLGPIDQIFQNFVSDPDDEGSRIAFFVGALGVYNTLMEAVRSDDPHALVALTQAMKINFDKFFEEHK